MVISIIRFFLFIGLIGALTAVASVSANSVTGLEIQQKFEGISTEYKGISVKELFGKISKYEQKESHLLNQLFSKAKGDDQIQRELVTIRGQVLKDFEQQISPLYWKVQLLKGEFEQYRKADAGTKKFVKFSQDKKWFELVQISQELSLLYPRYYNFLRKIESHQGLISSMSSINSQRSEHDKANSLSHRAIAGEEHRDEIYEMMP